MTFFDHVRVYESATMSNAQITEDAATFTRIYSPDHGFIESRWLIVENGLVRVALRAGTNIGNERVRLLTPQPWGAATASETWQLALGSGKAYFMGTSTPDRSHIVGIVRLSSDEVVIRRRDLHSTSGTFQDYDIIVRQGVPVVEIVPLASRGTQVFVFENTNGTMGLRRLAHVHDYVKNGAEENPSATADPGEQTILVYKESVCAISQQDSTSAILKNQPNQSTRFSPGKGSLFIALLTWQAAGLGDVLRQPLFREAENLTSELATQGTWVVGADAAAHGAAYLYQTTPAASDYVQLPLHAPIPGAYILAFRTYGATTENWYDSWTVTVDGVSVWNRPASTRSGSGFHWELTRPFLLTRTSVARFTVNDTNPHLLDAFQLIPLWRTTSTPEQADFPLDALYEAMRRVNVRRDVAHLEQV